MTLSKTPWGLGEVALGWLLAQFVGTFFAVGVLSGYGEENIPIGMLLLAQAGLWGGFVAAAYIIPRVKGDGWRKELRISFKGRDVLIGLVAGPALQLGLGLLYLPIVQLFTNEDLSEPAKELTNKADTGLGVFALLVMVAVGAPIVEELFYRGLLLVGLERRFSPAASAVISGLLFGLIHFQPLQFPVLAAFGTILALMVQKTGRLGTSIATHLAYNLTSVVLLLVFATAF